MRENPVAKWLMHVMKDLSKCPGLSEYGPYISEKVTPDNMLGEVVPESQMSGIQSCLRTYHSTLMRVRSAEKAVILNAMQADLAYSIPRTGMPYQQAFNIVDQVWSLMYSGETPPRWIRGTYRWVGATCEYDIVGISDEYVFIFAVGDED